MLRDSSSFEDREERSVGLVGSEVLEEKWGREWPRRAFYLFESKAIDRRRQ